MGVPVTHIGGATVIGCDGCDACVVRRCATTQMRRGCRAGERIVIVVAGNHPRDGECLIRTAGED